MRSRSVFRDPTQCRHRWHKTGLLAQDSSTRVDFRLSMLASFALLICAVFVFCETVKLFESPCEGCAQQRRM